MGSCTDPGPLDVHPTALPPALVTGAATERRLLSLDPSIDRFPTLHDPRVTTRCHPAPYQGEVP